MAPICHCRLDNAFMGASIGKKIEQNKCSGYTVGDAVSHSKIGTAVGFILYFCKFSDGMYAVVDYGKRRRVERIADLLPVCDDIYIRTNEEGKASESDG